MLPFHGQGLLETISHQHSTSYNFHNSTKPSDDTVTPLTPDLEAFESDFHISAGIRLHTLLSS